MDISISLKNGKMGAIPSFSLPSIVTCCKGCPCATKCYAHKLERIYPSVKRAYIKNLSALTEDQDGVFTDLHNFLNGVVAYRYFRWHVSGDIYSVDYFQHMVDLAIKNPQVKFLAFTKQYATVNSWLDVNGTLPDNLKIIFSAWDNGAWSVPNPHNLPMSHVIFSGREKPESWQSCGGNCANCAMANGGCWTLKNGQHIAFNEH